MSSTSVSVEIPAAPDRVWQLVGGFGSLPDWLPCITAGTLDEGGRVRSLRDHHGAVIEERLESYDQQRRAYSYSILQAPFPVTGYRSTLRVSAIPGYPRASWVEWSARFTAAGVADQEVIALIRRLHADGLAALKEAFDG